MRRPPLAAALLLCSVAASATIKGVTPVPEISAPVSAPPALAQLRADLAVMSVPTTLALPPSAVALSASAWSNVKAALAVPAAAAPIAAAPAATLPSASGPQAGAVANATELPVPPASPEALQAARARLEVAGQVLGGLQPGAFASLSDSAQRETLDKLWGGWKTRGLVAEPAAAPSTDAGRALDALVLEGVDDKALTHSNKSIFLGVGVLGYPLEDAVWLARTRIRDAIDENNLRYPQGQRWHTEDHTPEFLGQSAGAQRLLDDWGAAATLAAQIVRQAEAGSRELPKSLAAAPAAAAAFADVAADLARAGDREALEYLTGQDPTFSAFLLDVRKPGYYLYNGNKGAVARILATPAAQRMGLRRVEHGEKGAVITSSYIYRPARVAERLREAARETAAPHSDDERRRLAAYADRVAPLAARAPAAAPSASAYSFVDAEFLPGAVLDSAANVLRPGATRQGERADMPLSLATLRGRFASGERHPFFSAERWSALQTVLSARPALAGALDSQRIRFVAQPFQTGGKVVARSSDGAMVQLTALDAIAHERPDSPQRAHDVRFLATALEAALR